MNRQMAISWQRTPADWPGAIPQVARSRRLDELIALERIGSRLRFSRNQEIFAEGDKNGGWYQVVAGTVRICKLLADGRRYIVEFCAGGDAFGLEPEPERAFSAEAVGEVTVMRYARAATERLIDEDPRLARRLRETALKSLAVAHNRLLLLARLTAAERVASFLIERAERNGGARRVELPMSRSDIADYLGLTIETVCRVLSELKRRRIIAVPSPHRIELVDRDALEAIGDE